MDETLREKRRRAGRAGGRATAARHTSTVTNGPTPVPDDDGLVFGNAAQLREMAQALETSDTRTLNQARVLNARRVGAYRARHPHANAADLNRKVVCDTPTLDAPRNGPRLQVFNQDADTAEMWIYDYIDSWGDPFGISAAEIVAELADITAPNLVVHLNSGGGEVFEGIAIKRALAAHPANIRVSVDSLAASIASVIAMAGDTIAIEPAGMMMIHEASGFAYGNAADMHSMANLLDKVSDVIAGVYAARAGGEPKDWRTRMLAETWYTADEAIAAGLADHVLGAEPDEDEDEREDGDELAAARARTTLAASADTTIFDALTAALVREPAPDVDPNIQFFDAFLEANAS